MKKVDWRVADADFQKILEAFKEEEPDGNTVQFKDVSGIVIEASVERRRWIDPPSAFKIRYRINQATYTGYYPNQGTTLTHCKSID